MKTKIILAVVILAVVVAADVWLVTSKKPDAVPTEAAPASAAAPTPPAATMEGDKQVVEVFAKGGYSPREISAKAGVPTVLKIKTQGTFDCSTAFTIPKLGVRTNLPPNGETTFDIPAQKAGEKINGVCSMGMYSFAINFQ